MKESGKENDRHLVDSEEGRCEKKGTRYNCDIGFARLKLFRIQRLLVVYRFVKNSCILPECTISYI